eukprot:3685882-Rhodomonas_salina.1
MKGLKDKVADINAINNDGYQPIHSAASNGNHDCVKWLIEKQANIHAVDNSGCCPIHLAALSGHLEC